MIEVDVEMFAKMTMSEICKGELQVDRCGFALREIGIGQLHFISHAPDIPTYIGFRFDKGVPVSAKLYHLMNITSHITKTIDEHIIMNLFLMGDMGQVNNTQENYESITYFDININGWEQMVPSEFIEAVRQEYLSDKSNK